MSQRYDYLRDGAAIYRQSFATIRREANLQAFSEEQAIVVVRMIHACGMVDLANDVRLSATFIEKARAALMSGAPILCDSEMLAHGITRSRLPANNPVVCTLHDRRVEQLAASSGTTRSAAALDLWAGQLPGAIVAIGNAPTALFRLLELLDAGAPVPAALIGVPVGFVGAAESKQALENRHDIAFLTVRGRRGGSAIAAAALNALARPTEC
jgi:precorrin-8X/cobalt-precorrin-8 methylmutase